MVPLPYIGLLQPPKHVSTTRHTIPVWCLFLFPALDGTDAVLQLVIGLLVQYWAVTRTSSNQSRVGKLQSSSGMTYFSTWLTSSRPPFAESEYGLVSLSVGHEPNKVEQAGVQSDAQRFTAPRP